MRRLIDRARKTLLAMYIENGIRSVRIEALMRQYEATLAHIAQGRCDNPKQCAYEALNPIQEPEL